MFFEMMRMLRWVLFVVGFWGMASAQETQEIRLNPSGVILHYYGFGDDMGSLGTPLYRLDEHLRVLTEGGYEVESLSRLIERMNNRDKTLGERTIALVVSGGSKTLFTRAWRKFKEYDMPVTAFIPVDSIGKSSFLDWEDMRSMVETGRLDVGVQGRMLQNLLQVSADKIEKDLSYAKKEVKEKLEMQAKLFAYPYGIMSRSLGRMVYEAGFVAAITQHSGAFDHTHNRLYLPSFGMTKNYSDDKRLKLVLSTLALPIDRLKFDPLVKQNDNPPDLWVGYDDAVKGSKLSMSCFHSRQGRLDVENRADGFLPILVSPLRKGSSRLNCTHAVANRGTIWFGYQLYVPQ